MTVAPPYQGDIRKVFLEDESGILIKDGSANRDAGIENAIMYSLFVTDWFANVFATEPTQELRGKFLTETSKTITANQLLNIEDAAKSDLAWMISEGMAKQIDVETVVEESGRVVTTIEIYPPEGAASSSFEVSQYANNWRIQALQ